MHEFRRYLICLLILFIISWFILPGIFEVAYPKTLGPRLDDRVRTHFQAEIVREEPEVVLLGDSTLEVGVVAQELSSLIDKSVYKIGFEGSGSAVWYLIVKNNLYTSSYKPKYLILFFRDTMLTTPDFRVAGKYLVFVDELADAEDELLILLAYLNQMSWVERAAEGYIPLYGERFGLRSALENSFKYGLAGSLLGDNSEEINHALEFTFNTANLDPEIINTAFTNSENYLFAEENLDFESKVNQSFLPEMIRLCEEAGIRLIFVRVKTLFYPPEDEGSLAFHDYHESLENYLASHGIPLIDFSRDERVSPEWFVDVVHFGEEGRMAFTRLLAEELKEVLK
jgi:hypothetical protein